MSNRPAGDSRVKTNQTTFSQETLLSQELIRHIRVQDLLAFIKGHQTYKHRYLSIIAI